VNVVPALIDEEHPLVIGEDVPPAILNLDGASGRAEQPIRADLRVERDGENLLVTGWVQTTLRLQCGRCAELFPVAVRARAEHLFEAPHPNSIDLTPLIREDILLELPLVAACRLDANDRCPFSGEVYRARPETSGSLTGEAVWEALSKIRPKD
jgi:uncharacterized protein